MTKRSAQNPKNLALAQAIHSILDRRGISQRRHRVALEAALGLQYHQVRRRMTGEQTWTVGELARLAAHFGESAMNLIAILVDDEGQPASLQVQGDEVPCTVWLGEMQSKGKLRGPLVAVQSETAEAWVVTSVSGAGARPACEIRRLLFEKPAPWRVAVVDADQSQVARLTQFLQGKGIETVGFRSYQQAHVAFETGRYDGAIIGWDAGDDAEALLQAVREHTQGPVLLVSDPPNDSAEQHDRLAAIVTQHGAQLYERPASALSLYSALEIGLRSATRGRAAP